MWKDLTMSQRADMMDLYLSKGITSLDDMRSLYDSSISDTAQGTSFSDGGSIHIKPENRGKFTALKERTGHSATWFKEHGTPAQKKMATFALNARHWKHGYGGNLYGGGGGIIGMPAMPMWSLRNAVAKRLYETTDAYDSYNIGNYLTKFATGKTEDGLEGMREHLKYKLKSDSSDNEVTRRWKGELNQVDIADELYAQYLGIPVKERHTNVRLQRSPYRDAYKMPITNAEWDTIIRETDNLDVGKNTSTGVFMKAGLNKSTIGKGHDKKGEYRSYGDSFDLNPFRGSFAVADVPIINKINDLSLGMFNPIEVYDRIYLDDYYKIPKEYRGGNFLPEIEVIGKKRKGKKHGYGGSLYPDGGWMGNTMRLLADANKLADMGEKVNRDKPKSPASPPIITTGGAGYIPPAPQVDIKPIVNLPKSVNEARLRLYNMVSPAWGFTDDTIKATMDTMLHGTNDFVDSPVGTKVSDPYVDGVWAEYLQIPKNKRRSGYQLQKSSYRPTVGDASDVNYYTIPVDADTKARLVREGTALQTGKNKNSRVLANYNSGTHTIGKGRDSEGDYVSYYDRFDLNPFSGISSETSLSGNPVIKALGLDSSKVGDLSFGIGKPLEFYDRIHLDDYYNVPQQYRGTSYLPEITIKGRK